MGVLASGAILVEPAEREVGGCPRQTECTAVRRSPIWRGRTSRDRADEYERYNYEHGVKPLIEKAMGVQALRKDRDNQSEFVTIAYWENVEAMAAFTGADPCDIHHLDRDPEFLLELPQSVQILEIRASHGQLGGDRSG